MEYIILPTSLAITWVGYIVAYKDFILRSCGVHLMWLAPLLIQICVKTSWYIWTEIISKLCFQHTNQENVWTENVDEKPTRPVNGVASGNGIRWRRRGRKGKDFQAKTIHKWLDLQGHDFCHPWQTTSPRTRKLHGINWPIVLEMTACVYQCLRRSQSHKVIFKTIKPPFMILVKIWVGVPSS